MTTQSTPGPWKAQQDCRSYRNEGIFDGNNPDPSGNQNAWAIYGAGLRIANLEEAESWRPQEQVNANALLMAAAPDLLETLRTCLVMSELQEKRHGYSIENAKIAENIRFAIAEATGE